MVLDVRLPGEDGLTALPEFRRRCPNVPVIVMTAYSTVKNAVQSMRNGAYDYIAKLIRGRESVDQLSGPIRIAQVSGIVASNGGLLALINLAAVLSVSIGLMNLLPVPMLDGGHLMFYLYEALRGRPGVGQTALFGSTLHISGTDAAALERTLRAATAGVACRLAETETGLEDVFIHLMGRAVDRSTGETP